MLPYEDVCLESYVWTEGMDNWDFAGNLLDSRILAKKHQYCPVCDGNISFAYESHPIDNDGFYRCEKCGFEFWADGTKAISEDQGKYLERYYQSILPQGHKITYKSCVQGVGRSEIVIDRLKARLPYCIIYEAERIYNGSINKAEKIELVEQFIIGDQRNSNGGIITFFPRRQDLLNQFYDLILRSLPDSYPFWQIFENFGEEYGTDPNFIKANDTLYFARPLFIDSYAEQEPISPINGNIVQPRKRGMYLLGALLIFLLIVVIWIIL